MGGSTQLKILSRQKFRVSHVIFFLLLAGGNTAFSLERGIGKVQGRVLVEEGPVKGGTLAFFAAGAGSDPADRTIQRIPERTALVDEQGRFVVRIQYGAYLLGYFSGRRKDAPGLPETDRDYFFAGGAGAGHRVFQVEVPVVDAGDVLLHPVTSTMPGPSFIVTGTVRTAKGRPLSGVIIVAKNQLRRFRPQYISRETDRFGRYTLRLPPGSYYLVARHRLRRFSRPLTGEYFGIWGVEGPAGEFGWFPVKKKREGMLHGQAGQLINRADITLYRIPDPVTQEEFLRAKGKEKK